VSRCEEKIWCQWDCSNWCLQLFLIVALVNKYVKVGSFETNEIALKLVPWIVFNGCLDEIVHKCYPCKKALCKLQGAFKNKLELFNACLSGFYKLSTDPYIF